MKRWHIKQIIGILLSLLVFAIYYSPVVQDIIKFPSELEMSEGQYQIIPFRLPMEVKIQADDKNVLKINGQSLEEAVIERKIDSPLIIQPQQQGKAALQFKLFGIIPVKDMMRQKGYQTRILRLLWRWRGYRLLPWVWNPGNLY
ncbi:MAG: stage sporulation protein [Clostridiales bacterium]|nr:stage sporulation protein [Clostridiales bacterium]